MLVFETAGVTLLATMVCAVVLSSSRGRFGDGYDGSVAPPLEPGGTRRPPDDQLDADDTTAAHQHHSGPGDDDDGGSEA